MDKHKNFNIMLADDDSGDLVDLPDLLDDSDFSKLANYAMRKRNVFPSKPFTIEKASAQPKATFDIQLIKKPEVAMKPLRINLGRRSLKDAFEKMDSPRPVDQTLDFTRFNINIPQSHSTPQVSNASEIPRPVPSTETRSITPTPGVSIHINLNSPSRKQQDLAMSGIVPITKDNVPSQLSDGQKENLHQNPAHEFAIASVCTIPPSPVGSKYNVAGRLTPTRSPSGRLVMRSASGISSGPAASHRSPVLSHRSPAVSHRSPVVGHMSPAVGHRSPVVGHMSPAVSHRSPVVSHRSPSVIHKSPAARHRSPVPGHRSMSSLMSPTANQLNRSKLPVPQSPLSQQGSTTHSKIMVTPNRKTPFKIPNTTQTPKQKFLSILQKKCEEKSLHESIQSPGTGTASVVQVQVHSQPADQIPINVVVDPPNPLNSTRTHPADVSVTNRALIKNHIQNAVSSDIIVDNSPRTINMLQQTLIKGVPSLHNDDTIRSTTMPLKRAKRSKPINPDVLDFEKLELTIRQTRTKTGRRPLYSKGDSLNEGDSKTSKRSSRTRSIPKTSRNLRSTMASTSQMPDDSLLTSDESVHEKLVTSQNRPKRFSEQSRDSQIVTLRSTGNSSETSDEELLDTNRRTRNIVENKYSQEDLDNQQIVAFKASRQLRRSNAVDSLETVDKPSNTKLRDPSLANVVEEPATELSDNDELDVFKPRNRIRRSNEDETHDIPKKTKSKQSTKTSSIVSKKKRASDPTEMSMEQSVAERRSSSHNSNAASKTINRSLNMSVTSTFGYTPAVKKSGRILVTETQSKTICDAGDIEETIVETQQLPVTEANDFGEFTEQLVMSESSRSVSVSVLKRRSSTPKKRRSGEMLAGSTSVVKQPHAKKLKTKRNEIPTEKSYSDCEIPETQDVYTGSSMDVEIPETQEVMQPKNMSIKSVAKKKADKKSTKPQSGESSSEHSTSRQLNRDSSPKIVIKKSKKSQARTKPRRMENSSDESDTEHRSRKQRPKKRNTSVTRSETSDSDEPAYFSKKKQKNVKISSKSSKPLREEKNLDETDSRKYKQSKKTHKRAISKSSSEQESDAPSPPKRKHTDKKKHKKPSKEIQSESSSNETDVSNRKHKRKRTHRPLKESDVDTSPQVQKSKRDKDNDKMKSKHAGMKTKSQVGSRRNRSASTSEPSDCSIVVQKSKKDREGRKHKTKKIEDACYMQKDKKSKSSKPTKPDSHTSSSDTDSETDSDSENSDDQIAPPAEARKTKPSAGKSNMKGQSKPTKTPIVEHDSISENSDDAPEPPTAIQKHKQNKDVRNAKASIYKGQSKTDSENSHDDTELPSAMQKRKPNANARKANEQIFSNKVPSKTTKPPVAETDSDSENSDDQLAPPAEARKTKPSAGKSNMKGQSKSTKTPIVEHDSISENSDDEPEPPTAIQKHKQNTDVRNAKASNYKGQSKTAKTPIVENDSNSEISDDEPPTAIQKHKTNKDVRNEKVSKNQDRSKPTKAPVETDSEVSASENSYDEPELPTTIPEQIQPEVPKAKSNALKSALKRRDPPKSSKPARLERSTEQSDERPKRSIPAMKRKIIEKVTKQTKHVSSSEDEIPETQEHVPSQVYESEISTEEPEPPVQKRKPTEDVRKAMPIALKSAMKPKSSQPTKSIAVKKSNQSGTTKNDSSGEDEIPETQEHALSPVHNSSSPESDNESESADEHTIVEPTVPQPINVARKTMPIALKSAMKPKSSKPAKSIAVKKSNQSETTKNDSSGEDEIPETQEHALSPVHNSSSSESDNESESADEHTIVEPTIHALSPVHNSSSPESDYESESADEHSIVEPTVPRPIKVERVSYGDQNGSNNKSHELDESLECENENTQATNIEESHATPVTNVNDEPNRKSSQEDGEYSTMYDMDYTDAFPSFDETSAAELSKKQSSTDTGKTKKVKLPKKPSTKNNSSGQPVIGRKPGQKPKTYKLSQRKIEKLMVPQTFLSVERDETITDPNVRRSSRPKCVRQKFWKNEVEPMSPVLVAFKMPGAKPSPPKRKRKMTNLSSVSETSTATNASAPFINDLMSGDLVLDANLLMRHNDHMAISKKDGMSRRTKNGVEFICYATQNDISRGFMKFQPHTFKKQCMNREMLEVLMVTGSLTITLNAESSEIENGDFFLVKPNTMYSIHNHTDDVALAYFSKTPSH